MFLFSQFSVIEIIIFDKKFLYRINNIDSLKSIIKRYFTSDQGFGSLKIANLAMLWSI